MYQKASINNRVGLLPLTFYIQDYSQRADKCQNLIFAIFSEKLEQFLFGALILHWVVHTVRSLQYYIPCMRHIQDMKHVLLKLHTWHGAVVLAGGSTNGLGHNLLTHANTGNNTAGL